MTSDVSRLVDLLPRKFHRLISDPDSLVEIVLDYGRPLEFRYRKHSEFFEEHIVQKETIVQVTNRITSFGEDYRAGLDGTLHRISKIVNRTGETIGLTCRVGKAFTGTERLIQDYLDEGKSILLLGKPGSGKSSMLRSCAKYISESLDRRVVVIDTSDEIAGSGDIPHPAVGRARKMSVPNGKTQHEMMLLAVENTYPEVLVIDEISDDREVIAAKTVSKRGVQLLASAHGKTLSDLLQNPPLVNLLGGVKTVTLSDQVALKRGTGKSVLERQSLPTFDLVIELVDFDIVNIYDDLPVAIDNLLSNYKVVPEQRRIMPDGRVLTTVQKSLTRPQIFTPQVSDNKEENRNGKLFQQDPVKYRRKR